MVDNTYIFAVVKLAYGTCSEHVPSIVLKLGYRHHISGTGLNIRSKAITGRSIFAVHLDAHVEKLGMLESSAAPVCIVISLVGRFCSHT